MEKLKLKLPEYKPRRDLILQCVVCDAKYPEVSWCYRPYILEICWGCRSLTGVNRLRGFGMLRGFHWLIESDYTDNGALHNHADQLELAIKVLEKEINNGKHDA